MTVPYAEKVIEFCNKIASMEQFSPEFKLEIGLFLREAGHRWDSIFLLALAKEYYDLHHHD